MRTEFGATGVRASGDRSGHLEHSRERRASARGAARDPARHRARHDARGHRRDVRRGTGRGTARRGDPRPPARSRLSGDAKCCPATRRTAGTLAAAERSLARLQTDYLDLYLLHWPGEHPLEETMRALETLVDRGKTRFVGVSNFDVDEMLEAAVVSATSPARVQSGALPPRRARDRAPPAAGRSIAPHRGRRVHALRARKLPARTSAARRVLESVARKHGATPRQVVLAFLTRGTACSPFRKPPRRARARRTRRREPAARRCRRRRHRRGVSARRRTRRWRRYERRPHPASIKERAIRTALRLGAGDVRVTQAIADARSRRRMQASFARDDLADVGLRRRLTHGARSDPASVLRGARSVICIAFPYATAVAARRAR